MKRFTSLALVSALVNIVASLVGAWVLVAWQAGFGSGDTVSFFFYTWPLAFGVAVVGPVLLRLVERVPAGRRWLLMLGAALLCTFGWLYVVLRGMGPWGGAFSFPLAYPWLVGVAAQLFFQDHFLLHAPEKVVSWRHLLANFLLVPGVLLVLLGGSWLHSYLNRPTPETYLIPANFRGDIRVAYKEKGGVNPPLENGRLVMRIPPDGILLIQPEFRPGMQDTEFYLVDEAGRRERLFDGTQAGEPSRLRPNVRSEGMRGIGGEMPISYAIYTVYDPGAPAETEAVLLHRQERRDSLLLLRIERSRLPQ